MGFLAEAFSWTLTWWLMLQRLEKNLIFNIQSYMPLTVFLTIEPWINHNTSTYIINHHIEGHKHEVAFNSIQRAHQNTLVSMLYFYFKSFSISCSDFIWIGKLLFSHASDVPVWFSLSSDFCSVWSDLVVNKLSIQFRI